MQSKMGPKNTVKMQYFSLPIIIQAVLTSLSYKIVLQQNKYFCTTIKSGTA